jgi:hypothetical protein
VPQPAGTVQSFTITGLSQSTTYYFAIKTANGVSNWSLLSNSPMGTTQTASSTVYVATDGSGNYNCPTTRTDCNIEINNALSYVHSLGGGTVHLKSGTYVISDKIVIYDNSILEGDGWTSVIKLTNSAGWPQNKALIENEKKSVAGTNINIRLRNFKVDGNQANQAEGLGNFYYSAVHIANANGVYIQNLSFLANGNDQIKTEKVKNVLVENSYFEYPGHSAIYFLTTDNATARNNIIHPYANSGVRTYNANNVYILDNIIDDPFGIYNEFGLELTQEGTYITNNVVVQNNTIHNTGLTPIWLAANPSSSDSATGVKIIGNRIYHGARLASYHGEMHGIVIQNFNNTLITNNDIYNNMGSGIVFDSAALSTFPAVSWNLYATVSNNIIMDNTEYGLDTVQTYGTFINTYNDIFNNTLGMYRGASSGTGEISVNPLYAQVSKRNVWDGSGYYYIADFHLKSQNGRYTPNGWVTDSVTSPAIDAGDPASPYSLEPMPNGNRINMGAYGNTPQASRSGGTLPSFDFSLTNSGSTTINQGSSGSNIITASLTSGSTQSVTFSFSGLPPSASASLNGGNSCSPTCSQTLTIYTTTTTPSGTYSINVSALNGTITRTTSFNLVVNQALSSPTAPINLIVAAGDSQVTLSWQVPSSNGGSPVTNYSIYRGTISGNEVLLAELGNVLTYTDSGLTKGQKYFYKVSARNGIGEGTQSNEASAVPLRPIYIVVTLYASNDTSIKSGAPNTVRSALTWIDIGSLASTSSNYRGLLNFNLSTIPSSVQINNAVLTLAWEGENRNLTSVIDVFKPSSVWDAQYATWNSRQNGILWTMSGGDWTDKNGIANGNTPYAEITYPLGSKANANFDLTSLVHEYVSGSSPNNGFFLKANEVNNTYISFLSSESSNITQRPRLVINYTNKSG